MVQTDAKKQHDMGAGDAFFSAADLNNLIAQRRRGELASAAARSNPGADAIVLWTQARTSALPSAETGSERSVKRPPSNSVVTRSPTATGPATSSTAASST